MVPLFELLSKTLPEPEAAVDDPPEAVTVEAAALLSVVEAAAELRAVAAALFSTLEVAALLLLTDASLPDDPIPEPPLWPPYQSRRMS